MHPCTLAQGPVSHLGSSLRWVMSVVSVSHFLLYCEQSYSQLGLGCLGRNLGQVGRRVAMGAVLGQSCPGAEEEEEGIIS